MIAANGASEDELAAIAAALSLLHCHPEHFDFAQYKLRGEAAKSRESQSLWLATARREAVGLD